MAERAKSKERGSGKVKDKDNPYAQEYIPRPARGPGRPVQRQVPITFSQPRLEQSLMASIFGDQVLQVLIQASFNCQEREKLPNFNYFSETLAESTDHTEEEIRQSIISLSGRFFFTAYPTPESRSQIHRLDPPNPQGEEHGLLRIPGFSSCDLELGRDLTSPEFRIFYRVIKGSIQIDSSKCRQGADDLKANQNSAKKYSCNTEIEIPPSTGYSFSNPNCVSCLLYYTIENSKTIHLRKREGISHVPC